MSSASTLARRAARLARANAVRLVGDLAVGPPRPHLSRSAFLNHDGAARELAHVRPWHAFGREALHARGFNSVNVAHRRAGDPAPPVAADAGAGVGPDTRASSDPKTHRNAAVPDASSDPDPGGRAVPGQSRIVRVANFVARDLLTAGSLGELVAKMREHRDMAYLVATREASPFPFVFRSGCKFDERGAFSRGARGCAVRPVRRRLRERRAFRGGPRCAADRVHARAARVL